MASQRPTQQNNESDYEVLMHRLQIGDNKVGISGGATFQRTPGAIENFIRENSPHRQQMLQQANEEYKIYERNNIIAASKYATPKPIEQLAAYNAAAADITGQMDTHSNGSGGNGSINSPRYGASSGRQQFIYEHHHYQPIQQKQSPVYENLDFYGNSGGHFESTNKRAQPQQAAPQSIAGGGGMGANSSSRNHYLVMQATNSRRYAHTPVPEHDHMPIYENIIPHSGKKCINSYKKHIVIAYYNEYKCAFELNFCL